MAILERLFGPDPRLEERKDFFAQRWKCQDYQNNPIMVNTINAVA